MASDREFNEMFSLRNLKNTWKVIRKDLKTANVRDCIDYLEYELNLDHQIKTVRERILSGSYTPKKPSTFEMAKTKGAYRTLSILHLEDALVYRVIADQVYNRLRKYQKKGVFFSRKHTVKPIGQKGGEIFLSTDNFKDFYEDPLKLWKRYQQYRTKTLLNSVHPVLVVTDITNYFESVHHELLLEYISPAGLPRKAIGLLGRMLEEFKPSCGLSPNPRIGLPVEEHDASRQLAHVYLFEHDVKITNHFGEDNYVRWMDDQTIAVRNKTQARITVRLLTKSLAEQRLVLNSGKTKFLTANEVVEVFHLDSNQDLDEFADALKSKMYTSSQLKKMLNRLYQQAKKLENVGHWDKILKRIYYYAGKIKWDGLVGRVYDDLIEHPHLSERIFEYIASTGNYARLLRLFKRYVERGESLYESVETNFFEVILYSNIDSPCSKQYREFCRDWIIGKVKGTERAVPKGAAAIALYWLGDRRSVPTIINVLQKHGHIIPNSVARSLLVSLLALDHTKINDVMSLSAQIGGQAVTSLGTMLNKLQNNPNLKAPANELIAPKNAFIGGKIYDARSWLKLSVLGIAVSPTIRNWVKKQHKKISVKSLGSCERRVSNRLGELIKKY
ncbi:RNA-directed DNA polymerase [Brevibacillus brevis]|uniref:RNA-directed DNA polymerase n=1 Tax=Brevibacillus brevis TaxID=1393 RepID=UPI000D0EAA3B|nr:RNA-directed DNA polymerase [Brevibacillus brevis]PSJ63537.1 hypothetical protein C7J99_31250 [Brevibacillus brevis]RED33857.1 reverse transcriptase (RNA-dependent DNA polymerase) [Brevibacillus brevis]GEC93348.1 hypothetical protein BBR01nite_56790 [Brevibacillus brevis]VEF92573.1 Retron-type reverse transcriptase [Brevibacillus brevis]